MERTVDPGLREILLSLVKHLHATARELSLTKNGFHRGAALVAALGQQSSDRDNEAVLMAGSLGLSQLICMMNSAADGPSA